MVETVGMALALKPLAEVCAEMHGRISAVLEVAKFTRRTLARMTGSWW